MKWVRRLVLMGALSGLAGGFTPGGASAQAPAPQSGQITLSLTVLEHRGIIVDSQQNITEIFSNTPNDITPTVSRTMNGPQLPLTPSLNRQYHQLMGQLKPNPYVIITRAKTAIPANLVEPDATTLYTVAPAAVHDDPSHLPYFIQLDQAIY